MIQVAMMRRLPLLLLMTLAFAGSSESQSLRPAHGDFVIKNFRFTSGEVLPALRLHYRTLGKPRRDANGLVRNAVLILHGTGGSGAQFEAPTFAGQLFVAGGLLDATRYFLIMPDALGFGQSSKPSDGLRAGFPWVACTRGSGVSGIRTSWMR
jgi:homoserine O-acetyltransferase